MRFRAEQHLRRPSEIRVVREKGRRIECHAFTLWWKPRARGNGAASRPASAETATAPDAGLPRVCVVASGAALGIAVRRNRAKRRLRELFRNNQSAVPGSCDLLLVARKQIIDCPVRTLEEQFSHACRRIRQAQGATE